MTSIIFIKIADSGVSFTYRSTDFSLIGGIYKLSSENIFLDPYLLVVSCLDILKEFKFEFCALDCFYSSFSDKVFYASISSLGISNVVLD
jgi:hypothetical protein